MGDLRAALARALDGPDVESVYECAHCGAGHPDWRADCAACGGAVMRVVTDAGPDATFRP